MHEWALAEAVLEATSSAMEGRNPQCLRTVTVMLGELQAIEREIFEFAIKTLVQEKLFSQASFVIETEAASFTCGSCGHEWDLSAMTGLEERTREAIHFLPEAAHAFIRCPSCAGPDYRVRRGRGVSIREIVVATDGDCA